MRFKSDILIVPGLGNSGPEHWQSRWEREYGFKRIEQKEWDTPVCSDWIEAINSEINNYDPSTVILVCHSLACSTIAYWSQKFNARIKATMLVGPSDTEAETYPPGTTGFSPIPLIKLPFRSIVVASTNDYYVSIDRSILFAKSWGSELINIGDAGHINVNSGHGKWDRGIEILGQLD